MNTVIRSDPSNENAEIGQTMIRLLHDSTPLEIFAEQLAHIEKLPDAAPAKAARLTCVRMAIEVRERLELHHQRELGMLAVIESARELSSRLDLSSLLATIVTRARTLLGSDVAWLSIHDAARGAFQVLVTDGAMVQGTSQMVAGPGRGVASIVMNTRTPFTTPDYLHDNRFVHDPALDDVFRAEGIAALVGVPLLCDGELNGLLFVADRYHRVHTPQSVAILSTLATHAAVALRNAQDFKHLFEQAL